ncbi:MAG: glucose 1-dehydrogenase [Caulobacteraceae bacterium]|nr:glucose 1-dehydrogenase [Caulobacteraceae bacterium]
MGLFDLKGRAAIVTGGNGGIGLGIAKGLAEAGAAVAIIGRNREKNLAAVAELESLGAAACALEADLAQEGSCQKAVEDAARRLGRLDILVNNAGVVSRRRPEVLSLDEWRWVLDTNLTSAFVASKAAHPLMKAAGGGKIINIGSMYSVFGAAFTAAYGATKGGLVQLTKAQAAAWARDNIQVNAILPGWIETEMTASARQNSAEFDAAVIARTPARRWGRPDDMAGPAVFLASAASGFVTGATLAVDGGYSAFG